MYRMYRLLSVPLFIQLAYFCNACTVHPTDPQPKPTTNPPTGDCLQVCSTTDLTAGSTPPCITPKYVKESCATLYSAAALGNTVSAACPDGQNVIIYTSPTQVTSTNSNEVMLECTNDGWNAIGTGCTIVPNGSPLLTCDGCNSACTTDSAMLVLAGAGLPVVSLSSVDDLCMASGSGSTSGTAIQGNTISVACPIGQIATFTSTGITTNMRSISLECTALGWIYEESLLSESNRVTCDEAQCTTSCPVDGLTAGDNPPTITPLDDNNNCDPITESGIGDTITAACLLGAIVEFQTDAPVNPTGLNSITLTCTPTGWNYENEFITGIGRDIRCSTPVGVCTDNCPIEEITAGTNLATITRVIDDSGCSTGTRATTHSGTGDTITAMCQTGEFIEFTSPSIPTTESTITLTCTATGWAYEDETVSIVNNRDIICRTQLALGTCTENCPIDGLTAGRDPPTITRLATSSCVAAGSTTESGAGDIISATCTTGNIEFQTGAPRNPIEASTINLICTASGWNFQDEYVTGGDNNGRDIRCN